MGVALLAMIASAGAASSAAAGLPDHRAYELVSPPDKAGADVIPLSNKTHAASDGSAVAFEALGGFGPIEGASADVAYVSRRDGDPETNGWSSRAINPLTYANTRQGLLLFGIVPTFEAAFTPDLSAAIFRPWRPLTDAPNVAGVPNLYRLSDLGTGSPVVQLLTDSQVPPDIASLPDPIFALFFKATFNGASRDLRHVIFQSPWRLTGDGSFDFTGNLYEYADGAGVRLVARVPSGGATTCDDRAGPPCEDAPSSTAGISARSGSISYSAGMISDDGARIGFQVPGGFQGGPVYMREDGTRTFQLNASEKRTPDAPQSAQLWAMSADGKRAFFTTGEALRDSDQGGGLYMYDRTAPAGRRLTLLSATSAGACAADSVIGTSNDGHYVYFVCSGQQLQADAPADPQTGLYLWHDGAITYIGRFAAPGEGSILNTPQTSYNGETTTKPSRVTPDGRSLLFATTSDDGFSGQHGFAGFDHGDTCTFFGLGTPSPCRELYLFSAATGRLVCVSCTTTSDLATSDAITDVLLGLTATGVTQHLSHALSDDSNRVFFSSTDALVPGDVNRKVDAYEYDVASGTVHLISSGTDPSDSYFLDASPDGHDVFFTTRERLVGWDVDSNADLYDARVDGGFPDPAPAQPQCTGDTCRPQSSGQPVAPSGASAGFRGAGDKAAHLRRHRRCKRGRVLRKVRGKRRCVRRRAARRHATRSRALGERSGK